MGGAPAVGSALEELKAVLCSACASRAGAAGGAGGLDPGAALAGALLRLAQERAGVRGDAEARAWLESELGAPLDEAELGGAAAARVALGFLGPPSLFEADARLTREWDEVTPRPAPIELVAPGGAVLRAIGGGPAAGGARLYPVLEVLHQRRVLLLGDAASAGAKPAREREREREQHPRQLQPQRPLQQDEAQADRSELFSREQELREAEAGLTEVVRGYSKSLAEAPWVKWLLRATAVALCVAHSPPPALRPLQRLLVRGAGPSTSSAAAAATRAGAEPGAARLPAGEVRVRAVSWHHYLQRVAVLLSDDCVRVFDVLRERWDDAGELSHELQRDASCLEWQPLSGTGLAVASRVGVCLWRNGLQWVSLMPCEQPVAALAWHPNGRTLASAAAWGGAVTVWDCATRERLVLTQLRGPARQLAFAPSGLLLYAGGTQGEGYCVWETRTWDCEAYSDAHRPVQAALWAAQGHALLVVSGRRASEAQAGAAELLSGADGAAQAAQPDPSELVLHAFALPHEPPRIDAALLPVALPLSGNASVRECALSLLSSGAPCPAVQCVAMDDKSSRLAVAYRGLPGVALYACEPAPAGSLRFFLVGHVWGPPGALPIALAFKPRFERGALLCATFSDAQPGSLARDTIRFVPMYS
jgi:hypothetical protein